MRCMSYQCIEEQDSTHMADISNPMNKAPYVSPRCKFKRAAGEDPGIAGGDAMPVSFAVKSKGKISVKEGFADFGTRDC